MPKKYRVIDQYENYGIIGEFDKYGEACKAAELWKTETDGECNLVMLCWNANSQVYESAIII